MFKTVLFPIDQSREAREAADVVANVVQKYGSRLVLLSVVEEPPPEAPSARSNGVTRGSCQTAGKCPSFIFWARNSQPKSWKDKVNQPLLSAMLLMKSGQI